MATSDLNLKDLLRDFPIPPDPAAFSREMYTTKKSTEMPGWMKGLILAECNELGMNPPKHLKKKVIKKHANFDGGYTIHSIEGEIVICLGQREHNILDEEAKGMILLHELAHWTCPPDITNRFDDHSPEFYAELIRLCLKYGVDVKRMAISEEGYTGDKIYEGMVSFHMKYNEPVNPWEKPSREPMWPQPIKSFEWEFTLTLDEFKKERWPLGA